VTLTIQEEKKNEAMKSKHCLYWLSNAVVFKKKRQVSHYILKVCFYTIKDLIFLVISSLLLAYNGKVNGRCMGTSTLSVKKQTIVFRILQYSRNAPIAHLVECMICLKY